MIAHDGPYSISFLAVQHLSAVASSAVAPSAPTSACDASVELVVIVTGSMVPSDSTTVVFTVPLSGSAIAPAGTGGVSPGPGSAARAAPPKAPNRSAAPTATSAKYLRICPPCSGLRLPRTRG